MSDLPAPDALEGAPHPCETPRLFGHAAAEADFLQAFAADRLHSGWLLSGPRGVGKATLAYRIAAFLLAQPPAGGLFGAPVPAALDVDRDGPDMRQILAGAHPRLFVLRRGPNQTGSALSEVITVGNLRKLKEFFQLSAADGGWRVVIVDAADEMNVSAANALLKELEEPPAQTALLLISHQPSRLLPTIRSRCRTLRLQPLGEADMAAALAQADCPFSPALAALAAGSVGDAIRLQQQDGLALYERLLAVVGSAPRMDRQAASALADLAAGKAAAGRFRLILDLLDLCLARLACSGLSGPPALEAAPGEAAIMARLCPHDQAARDWARLAGEVSADLRHGQAVNIDPSALLLTALLRIEGVAQRHG